MNNQSVRNWFLSKSFVFPACFLQNLIIMAMLAEPRRKQKWTLNPRGKQWSDGIFAFYCFIVHNFIVFIVLHSLILLVWIFVLLWVFVWNSWKIFAWDIRGYVSARNHIFSYSYCQILTNLGKKCWRKWVGQVEKALVLRNKEWLNMWEWDIKTIRQVRYIFKF